MSTSLQMFVLLQDCRPRNESSMTCYVPFIKLPPELITANSSEVEDSTASSGRSRKRRSTAEVTGEHTGGGWIELLWQLLRPFSWLANQCWKKPRFLEKFYTFRCFWFVTIFKGFCKFLVYDKDRTLILKPGNSILPCHIQHVTVVK